MSGWIRTQVDLLGTVYKRDFWESNRFQEKNGNLEAEKLTGSPTGWGKRERYSTEAQLATVQKVIEKAINGPGLSLAKVAVLSANISVINRLLHPTQGRGYLGHTNEDDRGARDRSPSRILRRRPSDRSPSPSIATGSTLEKMRELATEIDCKLRDQIWSGIWERSLDVVREDLQTLAPGARAVALRAAARDWDKLKKTADSMGVESIDHSADLLEAAAAEIREAEADRGQTLSTPCMVNDLAGTRWFPTKKAIPDFTIGDLVDSFRRLMETTALSFGDQVLVKFTRSTSYPSKEGLSDEDYRDLKDKARAEYNFECVSKLLFWLNEQLGLDARIMDEALALEKLKNSGTEPQKPRANTRAEKLQRDSSWQSKLDAIKGNYRQLLEQIVRQVTDAKNQDDDITITTLIDREMSRCETLGIEKPRNQVLSILPLLTKKMAANSYGLCVFELVQSCPERVFVPNIDQASEMKIVRQAGQENWPLVIHQTLRLPVNFDGKVMAYIHCEVELRPDLKNNDAIEIVNRKGLEFTEDATEEAKDILTEAYYRPWSFPKS